MPVINVRATYIGEIIQSETLFTLVTFMASNVREKQMNNHNGAENRNQITKLVYHEGLSGSIPD